MKNFDRRDATYIQLCAIARVVIEDDPSQGTADWAEGTKVLLAKQGYAEPNAGQLSRALDSVQRALEKEWGPRPIDYPTPFGTPPEDLAPMVRESRNSNPPGWSLIQSLLARLAQGKTDSGHSLPPRPAVEPLDVDEAEALDAFWQASRNPETSRIGLLRAYASIALVKPAQDRPSTVTLAATECFGCANTDRPRAWQFVIPPEQGGSRAPRNQVSICARCRNAAYPWLPPAPDVSGGLTRVSDIAGIVAKDPDVLKPTTPLKVKSMRGWDIANVDGRCSYNYEHRFKKGEEVFRIRGKAGWVKTYCRDCGIHRHEGEGAPAYEPAQSDLPVLALKDSPSEIDVRMAQAGRDDE